MCAVFIAALDTDHSPSERIFCQYLPALWAVTVNRLTPRDKIASRIVGATVERGSFFRPLLHYFPAILRAGYFYLRRRRTRIILAFRIDGAAKKRSEP